MKRRELQVSKTALAIRFGVCADTIRQWEAKGRVPEARYFPLVVEFLGYDPLPPPLTLGDRIRRRRLLLGLEQKETARRLSVSELTLSRWERGGRVSRERSERVTAFLRDVPVKG